MTTMKRRSLVVAAAAVGLTAGRAAATGGVVLDSAGTERPRAKAPANACDAHFHIIDPRYLSSEAAKPEGMTFDDYRLLQARLGTTRAVPVQPKNYGVDPTCLLDALQRFGGNGRGIAVLQPDVTDAELKRLDAGYVRGLRFSVWNPNDAVASIAMIEPLAKRIADVGWHVQLHMSGAQIHENAALLGVGWSAFRSAAQRPWRQRSETTSLRPTLIPQAIRLDQVSRRDPGQCRPILHTDL